jgi:hypothetical protein
MLDKHDKNISIHGAAVGKPVPVPNENISNRQHFHPSPLQQVEINKMMNYYGDEFYDDENEYYDHSIIGITNRNIETDMIEDMGLLNNALTVNNILNTNKKHLPPIEKLLTHKVISRFHIFQNHLKKMFFQCICNRTIIITQNMQENHFCSIACCLFYLHMHVKHFSRTLIDNCKNIIS